MGAQFLVLTFVAAAASAANLKANDVGANFIFDQDRVIEQCDVLASEKLGTGNYTYCSLDPGWSAGYYGDEHGRIIYDDSKFDIPKLADHLHAQGLKLGLYVVPGAFQADLNKTILGTDTKIGDVCSGDEGLARCIFDYTRPEVQTWHDSVVKQFADWGADLIKLDYITPGSPDNGQKLPADQSAAVPAWRTAILRSGRPMRLDISWKLDRSPSYFSLWNANAESMRSDQDINNSVASTLVAWATVQRAIENYRQWIVAALDVFSDEDSKLRVRPDLDNLYAGNAASITGVSDAQRRTIMTHWITAGANLITGSDLTRLDHLGLELLTNKNALAVADFAATYPVQSRNPGTGGQDAKQLQAWIAGPEPTSGRAVVVLANYGPDRGQGGFGSAAAGRQKVSATWEDLGLDGNRAYKVTNVWTSEKQTTGEQGLWADLDEGESTLLWPSPDDLEAAFQKIAVGCPLASSDSTQQSDTIYNIITTYHRLLEQHPNLVALLGDSSNGEFALFLPVNSAWEEAPGRLVDAADAGVLAMHISAHFIDEAYLRSMTNVPTVHEPETSNGPQVFPIRIAEDGWTVDGAGRFTQPSIRASNGIIYCIDRVILPPASLRDVLRARGSYATLLRAMQVSGFDEEELATQRGRGGTLFAPSDQAFASLGPDALQFLTEDDEGKLYLKALLKLHFCPDNTFYTNLIWPKNNSGARRTSADRDQVYKGKMGMELSSALQGEDGASKLAVSITRYMSCITMAVNSALVVEQDIGGNDGVAQGIQDVLLPRGTVGKGSQDVVGKIKAALQPFL
ncbi:hypothetical protein LLEC1_06485 [Akanthomyces lecanii]|uniref:Alpha-galactosidase n=1 Tax=Cordyceps confragosa TaxID=2714763 RepID=A0A179I6C9_CORDF|nr:hypothetical protein LLEC1_06485 [Akanthomyces lecanii]